MPKLPAQMIKATLPSFTSTETWTRHRMNPRILFTDGVGYVQESCEAGWLLDVIVSHQVNEKVRNEPFQVWTIKVDLEHCRGVVTCTDGDGNSITRQSIPFTDFPLDELTIWLVANTLLLPSEY